MVSRSPCRLKPCSVDSPNTLSNFTPTRLPYHRGKWRIVESALRLAGIEALDRGQTFEVGARGPALAAETPNASYSGGSIITAVSTCMMCAKLMGARAGRAASSSTSAAIFGYYSLLAAQRGARVFAFEPDPANFSLLTQQIALNSFDQIHASPFALSDAPGRARVSLPRPWAIVAPVTWPARVKPAMKSRSPRSMPSLRCRGSSGSTPSSSMSRARSAACSRVDRNPCAAFARRCSWN